jgi:hypothetical protein
MTSGRSWSKLVEHHPTRVAVAELDQGPVSFELGYPTDVQELRLPGSEQTVAHAPVSATARQLGRRGPLTGRGDLVAPRERINSIADARFILSRLDPALAPNGLQGALCKRYEATQA